MCAFQDAAIKYVMGGYVEATILEELVSTALQRAFFAQPPIPSLLVHSDRDRTR